MVITRTPYRVSFVGGGTDFPEFFSREDGVVLSCGIQKYLTVVICNRFEDGHRVSYKDVMESVDFIEGIRHGIVRESMKLVDVKGCKEVVTVGDLPGNAGLGSSSAVAVGVLGGLLASEGKVVTRRRLAELACEVEIGMLGSPIGLQDQYACAFGGLNKITFKYNGDVIVDPIRVSMEGVDEFESWGILFYIGGKRDAGEILRSQVAGMREDTGKFDIMRKMRDLVEPMVKAVTCGEMNRFAELLHEGWKLKKSLGYGISDYKIDLYYGLARGAGAVGGKLCGAGGGGFLLVMSPPERHEAIRGALSDFKSFPLKIDFCGSRLINV